MTFFMNINKIMKNKNKFEEDDFQEINYNEGLFSKRVKKI